MSWHKPHEQKQRCHTAADRSTWQVKWNKERWTTSSEKNNTKGSLQHTQGSQAHKRQNRTEHTASQIPHGTNSQAAAGDKLAESGIQIYQSSSTKRMAHTRGQQRLRLYCVVAYATSQPVLPESSRSWVMTKHHPISWSHPVAREHARTEPKI